MNPLALMMSRHMQDQFPDMVDFQPQNLQEAYGVLRAQQAVPKMPAARRPSTDAEIYNFIKEMAAVRETLPPALRLKLDKVLITIDGGQPENEAGWDEWEDFQSMKGRMP